MNTWILVIIYGIGGLGYQTTEYPSKESCNIAAFNLMLDSHTHNPGEKHKMVMAYCRPAKK